MLYRMMGTVAACALIGQAGTAGAQTAPAAAAQDAPPVTATAAGTGPAEQAAAGTRAAAHGTGGGDTGLGDVVVTARRRAESITKVPVSVTAVSGQGLREANVTTLADIGRIAPSVRPSPVAGRLGVISFSIRGMTETGGQITSDPAVGIYFADAIQTRAQGAGRSFYDIASVQILKGPQGTLFGRNTTGGAILIEPAAPVLGKVEGYVQGTYGNYNRREVQGAINVPLGDKLSFRAAANITRRDGYVTNLTDGVKLRNDHTESYRASLLFQPNDEFHDTLIFDAYNGEGRGGGFTPVAVNPAVNTAANPYASRLAALIRQQGRSIYDVEETFDSPSKSSNYGVTNTWVLDVSSVTLKNIFNMRWVRSNDTVEEGLAANLNTVGNIVRDRQLTDELQVSGKAFGDKLDYILGAYYFWEKGTQTGLVSTLGSAPRATIGNAINESASVFAQVDYHLTKTLSVTAGGRYTWDDRSLRQRVIETTGIQSLSASVAQNFKRPTWTLSLNYEPSANTLIYVTNRRGYRSGGFNSGAISLAGLAVVQPEILTDYEFGFKSQGSLGSVRYRTTLAIYHSDFTNIQRNVVALLGTPPAPTRILLNAAKAKVNGGEFEATLIPFRVIELSGYLGYTDPRYQSFTDPSTGADLSSLTFSQTPKWTYRVSGRINLPVPDSIARVSANADFAHQSSILTTDAAIQPGYVQPGYGLLSARLSAEDVLGTKIRVALFGTNLTKAKPTLASTPFYAAPYGLTSIVYGEPRMYGVEVGFKF